MTLVLEILGGTKETSVACLNHYDNAINDLTKSLEMI